jgi:hypothetical protein
VRSPASRAKFLALRLILRLVRNFIAHIDDTGSIVLPVVD